MKTTIDCKRGEEMRYECVANCPELDNDCSPHCVGYVDNDEDLYELQNKECPCGNNTKFINKEID